jgi:hypothetical protein
MKPSPTTPLANYLTCADAAARTGVTPRQIAHLCRLGPESGGIACIKLNPRLWLVESASLDEYEARMTTLAKQNKKRGRPRKKTP